MNISTSRIHRQTIAQDSKSLVLSLLGRLQRALADGTRPPQHILNEIRHITLDQQDLIRACVSAVRDVVSSRQIDVDADVWKEFFDLAPERQHLPDRDPRRKLRALASLTAIWGLEVTEHYGWKSKDTKNLEHLRRCALAYPDFDTFSKVANIVMLRRHEHSLFNARTPSIGYTSRGPRDPSPLTLQDLQILNQLSNKKNRGDVQHGRLLTAECVDDEKELIRVREWSRCSDGGLMIGDQALRNLRPQHYHQYLLEEDRFGLLCAAESTTDSGVRKANKRSGDSVSPLHAKLRRTNADRASGPNIVPGPDYQSRIDHATRDTGPSDNGRAGVDEAAEDSLQSTTCLDASVDTNKGRRTDGLTKTSSLQISASNLSAVRRCRLGSTNVALSTTSDNRASSEPVSPYSSMQKDLAMDRARSTTDPSTHQDPPQTPARIPPLALPAGCVDQAGPGRIDHSIFDHTSAGQHADILHSEAALENMETILSATHEEFTGPMAFIRGELDDGNATDLVVFPPGICDSKRSVLQHWAKVAHETESRAPHPVLKHWLHPIRYASIQSISASDESVDIDARTHDVLEMPYDVFRSRAGKGEVFSTPLLIREAFADAGEFSAKDYADSLQHTFPEMEVDVRYHSSEPEPLSVAEAARLVRAPPDTVLPNAPDFLDLESLSSAIKPGLTRLPRFRLLDTLVRGAKANYAGRSGKKTYLTPFDVANCQSFEILGLRGAFSGAHLDVLGGTWLRNLSGTKLWMVVPQRLMSEQDWSDFSKEGPSWNPEKKSRAIILRPGDVFFMPPGTRVIHAVLTLETCLMDGGMFWDDVTLLPLLHTIHWIGKNQKATNEALPFQLRDVLDQLEKVLGRDASESRFAGTASLNQAIRDLRSLGCECGLCEDTCPCSREDRRCTPLCRDHPMEINRECFEEPRSEGSDDADSLYGDDRR